MANYDYGKFMDQAQKDYERRNTPGKEKEQAEQAPEPAETLKEETETTAKGTRGRKNASSRTSAKGRKQKEEEGGQKKSMTVLLPQDVYVGLKMMSFRRMTKVSALICDLYRDEEEREKRRVRQ